MFKCNNSYEGSKLHQSFMGLNVVVIELKKGLESDKVVGQILRYMGWVKENLCKNGQSVRGLIICKDTDLRLSYALMTIDNIMLRYYQVDFKLSDKQFKM